MAQEVAFLIMIMPQPDIWDEWVLRMYQKFNKLSGARFIAEVSGV